MLMRYLNNMPKLVEYKIKQILFDRFAVLLDGCSSGGTYFISRFVTFTSNNPSGFDSLLLEMAQIGAEEFASAEEHYYLLKFVLLVYDKNVNNVVALIGDNEHTIKDFARQVRPILTGCHQHKLNLAAKRYVRKIYKRYKTYSYW